MSDYTKEQLKQMAIDTVATEGSKEYLNKIMQLSIKMGINPTDAEIMVRNMATHPTRPMKS